MFAFKDITNWTKGTEHINRLELFFKDRDHLIEKWETLKPDGTKVHFQFELTRKTPHAQRPTLNKEGRIQRDGTKTDFEFEVTRKSGM
jgi:hypothetical protein